MVVVAENRSSPVYDSMAILPRSVLLIMSISDLPPAYRRRLLEQDPSG